MLTQQPKLEMEATFRRIIPAEQRFGTRFVFREGSAIIPDNLRMVAASRAAATIIVSDSSRLATSFVAAVAAAVVVHHKHACRCFNMEDAPTHKLCQAAVTFLIIQQWHQHCACALLQDNPAPGLFQLCNKTASNILPAQVTSCKPWPGAQPSRVCKNPLLRLLSHTVMQTALCILECMSAMAVQGCSPSRRSITARCSAAR